MNCPQCHGLMEDGSLPVGEGLHWLRWREGLGDFAEHIPGTHAVMRPNHLEAWRCKKCLLILFRYGKALESKVRTVLEPTVEPNAEPS